MPKLEREQMINEISQKISDIDYFFVTDYMGLDANELNELRKKLYNAKTNYLVLKNTMGMRALKKSKIKSLSEFITGPSSIAYTNEDPVATSKVLVDFAKDHEALKIRGGLLKDKILDSAKIEELAALPPKEVLLAQVIGAINAPLSGLVTVLSGVTRGFVTVLNRIVEQKEEKK